MNKQLEEVERSALSGNNNSQLEESNRFYYPQNKDTHQDGNSPVSLAGVIEVKPANFDDHLSNSSIRNNVLGSFYTPW
eukprot:snap_masked-scaffold_28-processed-gene-4.40-mRNA-1 protein AED:1.00 eAED:1.00 QI:0/-1/0/0/-1/1/1/0/77